MKRFFIATVHIMVEADNESEASDAISECLTGNLQFSGAIKDWGYRNMSASTSLVDIGEINPDNYQEGDLYNHLKPTIKLMENIEITDELISAIYIRAMEFATAKWGKEPDRLEIDEYHNLGAVYDTYHCGERDTEKEIINISHLTKDLEQVAKERAAKLEAEHKKKRLEQIARDEQRAKHEKEQRRIQYNNLKK